MTKLEAVNLALAAVGESPVNSLSGTIPPDAANAVRQLDQATYNTLAEGWGFNTLPSLSLSPANTGELLVPLNTIQLSFSPHQGPDYFGSNGSDYVLRGKKIFDRVNNTFIISKTLTVYNVLQLLEWDEIPEVFQRYIALRGARQFIVDVTPSMAGVLDQQELIARAAVVAYELRTEDLNILNGVGILHHRFPR